MPNAKRFKWRKPKPMKDHPPAEQKDSERKKEPENPEISGRRIEIDFVNDLKKKHKTERDEDAAHANKQLRWTQIAAGLVFIYTAVMFWQACLTRQVARTTRDQLIASQRPWVGLDEENGLKTTPLMFDAKGNASLKYVLNAKNFGNYGAQSVFPTAKLLILQDISDLPNIEREFCNEYVSPGLGFALFPGDRARGTVESGGFVTPSQRITHAGSGNEFYAWLIACVSYSDQFNTPHHTVTEFRLGHAGTIEMIVFQPIPNTTVEGDWVAIHSYFLD
jgi:hypothetical protein